MSDQALAEAKVIGMATLRDLVDAEKLVKRSVCHEGSESIKVITPGGNSDPREEGVPRHGAS
jgi:hypothetical protein